MQQKHTADGPDFDAQAAKSILPEGVAKAMPWGVAKAMPWGVAKATFAEGTDHARKRVANPRKGMGTGKGEIVR